MYNNWSSACCHGPDHHCIQLLKSIWAEGPVLESMILSPFVFPLISRCKAPVSLWVHEAKMIYDVDFLWIWMLLEPVLQLQLLNGSDSSPLYINIWPCKSAVTKGHPRFMFWDNREVQSWGCKGIWLLKKLNLVCPNSDMFVFFNYLLKCL